MGNNSARGNGTKILAVAVIIALLGVGIGGYLALKPSPTPSTVTFTTTATMAVTGPTTTATTTATSTTAVTGPTTTTTTTATETQTQSVTETVTTTTTTSAPPLITVKAIAVGGANYAADPVGMAFDPLNNYMYVALENSSSVGVVNAATSALVTTIALPSGDAPVALAYDSANDMVYVANNNGACTSPSPPTCTIPVIDANTNTVATNIATNDTTNGVAIVPSTNTVLFTSNDDDSIFVVSGSSNQFVGILQNHGTFPDNAQSIAVDTATNLAISGNWYNTRTAAEMGYLGVPNSTGTNCLFKSTNESVTCVTKSETIDGGRIEGIAVNPNTGMIYLANYNAGVVNAISEATGADIANVTVPSPASVAVDPNTNVIYVASNATSTNEVFAISGVTNTVLTTVRVGTAPGFVAVDPGANTVFASNAADGTVSVFSGAGITGPAPITVGAANSDPQGMAFNPANHEMYVALQGSSSVAVINATNGSLVTTISLPSGVSPVGLAYDSKNGMVYVANSASDIVPIINGSSNTVASTITVPDTTNSVAVYAGRTGNVVFLASNDDDAVFFINGTSSAVTILQDHGAIPDNAQAIAVDTSTEVAVVGNWYHTRTAAEIGFVGLQSKGGCLATNTNSSFCVTKSVGLDGGQIDGVAVNSNTGLVYVANYKANVVNVISIATGKDLANVTVASPVGVLADPYSGLVYVASNATTTNSVVVINGLTDAVLANIPVGNGPANLALDSSNNTVYVSCADNGTVSGIEGTSLVF